MSLKYALLASLLDGSASGYDLAKRFDLSVANFWHALPQQLYAELNRMEKEGLVAATTVVQERRPNKRLYSITDTGRGALLKWIEEPSRPPALKSDLLVRLYAADAADAETLIRILKEERKLHEAKLDSYLELQAMLFRGRSEEEYVVSTRRVGPFITMKRGIMYEQENIAWCDWAVSALRARLGQRSGAGSPA